MDTSSGYWAVAVLSAGSLAIFYRLIPSIWALPPDRIRTEPYRPTDVIFILGILLGLSLLYAASALMAPAAKPALTHEAIVMGCLLNAGLISSILIFLWVRGIPPLELFGLAGGVSPRSLGIGLGFLLAAYPLILLAQLVSYAFTSPDAQPQEIVTYLLNTDQWLDRLTVAVLAVIMAPLTEELIFRGYLYGIVRKYGGRVAAIGVTSLLFAAIHFHAPALPALFILAVALCLAYERTGSLWVPIGMHACFNAVSVYVAIFHPELAQ